MNVKKTIAAAIAALLTVSSMSATVFADTDAGAADTYSSNTRTGDEIVETVITIPISGAGVYDLTLVISTNDPHINFTDGFYIGLDIYGIDNPVQIYYNSETGKFTGTVEVTDNTLQSLDLIFFGADNEAYTIESATAAAKTVPVIPVNGAGVYDVTLDIVCNDPHIEFWDGFFIGIDIYVIDEPVIFRYNAETGKFHASVEITDGTLECFPLLLFGADGAAYTIVSSSGTKREQAPVDPVTPPADTPVTPPTDTRPSRPESTPAGATATTTPSSSSTGTASVTTVSTPVQIAASKNSNITVNAAETDVTPAMLKVFTKNRAAKTMTLSCSSKLKIVINKSNISGTSANLDFSLSGKKFLPSKLIRNNKTLNRAEKIFQLDFTNNGDFGGVDKVTVKYRAGTKFSGKKVTVYEYVNGKLVKIGTGKVSGSGLVNFNTDHYGQVVIAVE